MRAPKVLALLVATGCVDPGATPPEVSEELRAKAPEALWLELTARQDHAFIVALQPTVTERAERADHKSRLLAVAPDSELAVEQDWDELPLVQVRASTLEAAVAVLERDEVAAAYEIEQFELTDAESFPLIGQPTAAAAGKTGAGTAVAVIDTGADYTRAALGSCTSPGVPSTCKVAFAADFAASDGALDDNGHGTNVSGIVLGTAPGAKVLALDVFSGGSASSTTIISAINWAISNKATYNIAAMNLSLGGGSSTTACTNDAMGIALGSARAAGIAPVVASGNSGLHNAISSPACAPAAISVGAVYDANVGALNFSTCADPTTAADKVTCFSNSASFLTVLAPGALITAAGYTMAGTSQAAPHVAGAMAVLRAAFPAESVDQQVARLTSTGKPILDARNGITKPRINLAAAIGSTAPTDSAPPTGTVTINSGATVTASAAVTLAITGSDASGVAQMCVTNTTTCTTFQAFAATKAWTLATGDGAKTVTVFLRDTRGNTTVAATSPNARITLDTKAPSNGTITAVAGNTTLALSWTGFADATSGIASYRLVAATGTTAPATCAGTPIYAGTATSVTGTGLANGTPLSFRVCALDRAGNVSTGAAVTATPHEVTAPTGTLAINGGASLATSRTVSLALAATDASGVAQMCISEATTCTAFVGYATSRSFTFPADGLRTLRVWYRDAWGNTSAPASATIRIDTTAPAGGTLTATAAAASIKLTWTAATDAGAGLAGYRLVGAPGTTAPATCSTGTGLYLGTATTWTHAVTSSATWSYRLCGVDVAGNISAGTVKTITALPAVTTSSTTAEYRDRLVYRTP